MEEYEIVFLWVLTNKRLDPEVFKPIPIVGTKLAEIRIEFGGRVLIDAAGVPPAPAEHRVDGPQEADADVLVVLPLFAADDMMRDVAGQRQRALVGWQQRRVGQPIGAFAVRPLRWWWRHHVVLIVGAQNLDENCTCWIDKRIHNESTIIGGCDGFISRMEPTDLTNEWTAVARKISALLSSKKSSTRKDSLGRASRVENQTNERYFPIKQERNVHGAIRFLFLSVLTFSNRELDSTCMEWSPGRDGDAEATYPRRRYRGTACRRTPAKSGSKARKWEPAEDQLY